MHTHLSYTFGVTGSKQGLSDFAAYLDSIGIKCYAKRIPASSNSLLINTRETIFTPHYSWGAISHPNGGYEWYHAPEQSDLIVALASMRDGKTFYEEEHAVFTAENNLGITDVWKRALTGCIMKVVNVHSGGLTVQADTKALGISPALGEVAGNFKNNFRKPTKEELIRHFSYESDCIYDILPNTVLEGYTPVRGITDLQTAKNITESESKFYKMPFIIITAKYGILKVDSMHLFTEKGWSRMERTQASQYFSTVLKYQNSSNY